jgi:hypothetical protein
MHRLQHLAKILRTLAALHKEEAGLSEQRYGR